MSGCLLKVLDKDSAFVSTFVVRGGKVPDLEKNGSSSNKFFENFKISLQKACFGD